MPIPKTAVVLGAGTAGTAAARSLADGGWKVIAAEPDRAGGTCLWRGCMPKKALYHAAETLRLARRADQFGIVVGDATFDWQGVLAWKWHAQETYAGDQEGALADRGVELRRAPARFVSEREVDLGGEVVAFDAAVVATGSEPLLPEIPGIGLADVSEDALHYPEPPTTLAIVGGGAIAMEFAAIYSAFGAEVTVLVRGDAPLSREDPDAVAVAVRGLASEGVRFATRTRVEALEGESGAITLRLAAPDGPADLEAERVLMATGRVPATAGLDLGAAGIDADDRGRLALDDALGTTNPRVWAAGDAAGGPMHTPVANHQGRTVARSILTGKPQPAQDVTIPTVVFTHPPVASVGLSPMAAGAADVPHEIHQSTYEYAGAAIIDDDRTGLVKLVVAPDGRLLGGAVAGTCAAELAYAIGVGVRARATASDLRSTLGIHPAFAELLNWAAW